jgi:hypothetical protein
MVENELRAINPLRAKTMCPMCRKLSALIFSVWRRDRIDLAKPQAVSQ